MFCVVVRCSSTPGPGPQGVFSAFSNRDAAETCVGTVANHISQDRGLVLQSYPHSGLKVSIGSGFVSRNTWEISIIEVKD